MNVTLMCNYMNICAKSDGAKYPPGHHRLSPLRKFMDVSALTFMLSEFELQVRPLFSANLRCNYCYNHVCICCYLFFLPSMHCSTQYIFITGEPASSNHIVHDKSLRQEDT